ncbi:MAG: EMC3/TMCO1 family protein [archaeon]|nr:EMC3/TMCO1 family protein [archaeon]
MLLLPDPAMDIALVAALFGLFSFIINRKLVDQKAMKASQKDMGEKRKKMTELMKKNDEKSKKELDKLNQEMMEATTKTMGGTLKAMAVVLIVFIPLAGFINTSYDGKIISLPLNVPFLGTETSWFWWWVVIGLVTSIVLQIGIKIFEMSKEKNKVKTNA